MIRSANVFDVFSKTGNIADSETDRHGRRGDKSGLSKDGGVNKGNCELDIHMASPTKPRSFLVTEGVGGVKRMTACPIAPISPTPNAQGDDSSVSPLHHPRRIGLVLSHSVVWSLHNEEFILLLIFSSTLLFALQSQVLPPSIRVIRHCSGFDVRQPHGNNSLPCRKRVPTV